MRDRSCLLSTPSARKLASDLGIPDSNGWAIFDTQADLGAFLDLLKERHKEALFASRGGSNATHPTTRSEPDGK